MAISVVPERQSTLQLSARAVQQLAMAALADMRRDRQKHVEEALEKVRTERCTHFWGLYSHPRYRTREIALEHAPEVLRARMYAADDERTCELFRRAAQLLIENAELSEEQRVLQVTLTDFRALT